MPVGIIRLLNTEPMSNDTNVLYLDNNNKLNFKNNDSSKGTIIANLQLDNIEQIQKNEIKTQTTSIDLIDDFTLISANSNLTINNNIIYKPPGDLGWANYTVYSQESYTGSAYIRYKILQTSVYVMIGLTTTPNGTNSFSDIEYTMYTQQTNLQVRYFGSFDTGSSSTSSFGTVNIEDIFEIIYDGLSVNYYKNGQIFHTSVHKPLQNETYYLRVNLSGSYSGDVAEILEFTSTPNTITNNLETINTSNNSFTFNGTSDYIEIEENIAPQLAKLDFTIEFWAKVNSTSGYPRVFSQGVDEDHKTIMIYFNINNPSNPTNNKLHINFSYGRADVDISALVNNSTIQNWNHFVIVFESSGFSNMGSVMFYLNGVSGTTEYWNGQNTHLQGMKGQTNASGSIRIGKSFNNNIYFNGELKHLRVYNTVKYNSNFSVDSTNHTITSNPYSIVLNQDLLLYVPMTDKQNIIYHNSNNTLSNNNNTLYSYQNELYFENGKVITENSQTAPIRFKNNYVGIGTKNPEYPLHVIGSGSGSIKTGSSNYLQYDMSNTNVVSTTEINSITIYATGNIYASGLIAASDNRIKTNIEQLVDNEALIKFRQLKPCKYNYIDTLTRTSEKVYGFIAQEVRETLPYATSITEEYIPNIYKLALYKDTVITFDNEHNLNSEGNIKLIKPNNTEVIVPYVIIDTHKINIITSNLSSDELLSNDLVQDEDGNDLEHNIFVYGTSVNDFHTLNKDAIWTTSTAALQEVDRIQQEDNNKINNLEIENIQLKDKVIALENKIPLLMDKVENILNKLLVLENN